MVLSMATNVQLIAQDTNRHAGRSNPFDAGYIPPMDSDGDGMWDDWELAHGLNPFDPSDALQDSDGDGRTNLDEFRTGGDPQVADSVTRVIGVQISGQEVRIALDGIRLGNRYALERRDSFVSGQWTIVQEFIGGPDPEVELTDSWDASGNAPHVYRLRFVHE